MLTVEYLEYQDLLDGKLVDLSTNPNICLSDHLGGFDQTGFNSILSALDHHRCSVAIQYILPQHIKDLYPNLSISFKHNDIISPIMESLADVKLPSLDKYFDNFVCSFNGSSHVSRQFLTAALQKLNWFDYNYSSKNFGYTIDQLDGNIAKYCSTEQERLYRKFIISASANDFYNTTVGFKYTRLGHQHNLRMIADKILGSFVQIVSETIGTSYSPFVTEKLLYPIVCKTLWVGYAQPGYHSYLEQYYGFKKYNKIFNYDFDNILNPVVRLVELLSMLMRFERLSKHDWHDLYLIELDTINYNYDWYYSKNYLTKISEAERE